MSLFGFNLSRTCSQDESSCVESNYVPRPLRFLENGGQIFERQNFGYQSEALDRYFANKIRDFNTICDAIYMLLSRPALLSRPGYHPQSEDHILDRINIWKTIFKTEPPYIQANIVGSDGMNRELTWFLLSMLYRDLYSLAAEHGRDTELRDAVQDVLTPLFVTKFADDYYWFIKEYDAEKDPPNFHRINRCLEHPLPMDKDFSELFDKDFLKYHFMIDANDAELEFGSHNLLHAANLSVSRWYDKMPPRLRTKVNITLRIKIMLYFIQLYFAWDIPKIAQDLWASEDYILPNGLPPSYLFTPSTDWIMHDLD